jgi:hypothetical protein
MNPFFNQQPDDCLPERPVREMKQGIRIPRHACETCFP